MDLGNKKCECLFWWTGSSWLRTGTGGGHLWMRW